MTPLHTVTQHVSEILKSHQPSTLLGSINDHDMPRLKKKKKEKEESLKCMRSFWQVGSERNLGK